jgi:hypothetical protein
MAIVANSARTRAIPLKGRDANGRVQDHIAYLARKFTAWPSWSAPNGSTSASTGLKAAKRPLTNRGVQTWRVRCSLEMRDIACGLNWARTRHRLDGLTTTMLCV